MTAQPPTDTEMTPVAARAADAVETVVGTIRASADPAEVRLVEALLAAGRPVLPAALVASVRVPG